MSAPTDRYFDVPTGGVLALLDAADASRDQLEQAQFVASFAPPIVSFSSCVCGRVMEVRSHDGTISEDDRDALRDFDDEHMFCEVDL